MVMFWKKKVKDLGTQKEVFEALPYAVVGGAAVGPYDGSFHDPHDEYTALTHIVPAGLQLKILFLRIWTYASGARFSIVQTNPTETGQTGAVEAHPVVGNVPPYRSGHPLYDAAVLTATRDFPMLEAAGAEILHGSLVDPIHVLEGSINFNILDLPEPATDARYGIVWWGVEKSPEE
ncbi:unnamed protein product [marine sediment metagenome]|uniref:Uncharacterized protein n=1 Tax=marine sediment metagenome TaxID=412755 RepID=X1UZU1_9ZZZZ